MSNENNETPDITPEVDTNAPIKLLTLSDGPAALITQAMARVAQIGESLKEAQRELNEKLAMVQPTGANGFDVSTMTFYSQPSAMPEGEPKE